jgi:hypothetical protein|tara:strand:+ start:3894 stop:4271 length:378 start_codon:yes stop_codon:yes gene_type:complete
VDTTKNSDDYFTAEELHEWISIMNEEKFTELAFRVLVEMNVDINILEKELSHIFYVQLMCGWKVDSIQLAELVESRRGIPFVSRFLRSVQNKPYLADQVRSHLVSKKASMVQKHLFYENQKKISD